MSSRTPIGPHDLGGQPGAAVDRAEHELAYWEQRVDAMVYLLFAKGVLTDAAQLRRGIEELSPAQYQSMSYYERWAKSAASNAVARGVVSEDELAARIEQLQARLAADS